MKKTIFSLIALAASSAAFAQATASGVNGLVTTTSGNQLINVTNGMSIPNGAVVSATGNGSVTISMPGCTATLGPGQSMPNTLQACQAFVANAGGTGSGGGSNVFSRNNLIIGASGMGLLAYNVNRNRRNPNAATPATPATPGVSPATPASPS